MRLRRFHNFALDMRWLLEPIINRKQWPKVKFKDKRAITAQEHTRVIAIDWDLERKAFYQLLWHLGGSQSDVALLRAENIDWQNKTLSYSRKKTGSVAAISFSTEVEKILCSLGCATPMQLWCWEYFDGWWSAWPMPGWIGRRTKRRAGA